MKKAVSLILAVLMLLAVSVPAFADAAPPIETEPEVLNGWQPLLFIALIAVCVAVAAAAAAVLIVYLRKKKAEAGGRTGPEK